MSDTGQPSGFRIRVATEGDARSIHELIAGCYAEYGWTFDIRDPEEHHLRAPHTWFRQHGGAFWTAWQRRTLAATAALRIEAGVGELKSLYVRKEHRRRGLGRALANIVLREAHARGCHTLALWSDVALTDAHRLYLSMNMRPTGARWVDAREPFAEAGFALPLAGRPATPA